MNKIGFRTIKTAIAVTLSIIVAKILDLEYPFFIAMTAIISMDKTMGNSLKMGRNRIVGTFFGACIGIALSYIDRGNPFLCGIGMIILIQVCNAAGLKGSITIGGIVLVAIMVHTDKTPLFYGFHRTLDTAIGASLSFLVNALIFPYSTIKRLDETTIQLWNQTDACIMALKNHEVINSAEIHNVLKNIEMELILYDNEFLLKKKRKYVDELKIHYQMSERLLLELEVLETLNRDKYPEVFEYHINQALNIYNHYIQELQTKHIIKQVA